MTRELPPGASTTPVTRMRNSTLALDAVMLAGSAAFIGAAGWPVVPYLAVAVPTSGFLVAVTLRRSRRLLGGSSPIVATTPVDVTGTRGFPPEVQLRPPGGVPAWWGVFAARRHVKAVPVGARGTRHVYEDGVAVVVVDGTTLWCPSWRDR